MDLNLVVFEERMIKSGLVRDMNTVYYVPIWALLDSHGRNINGLTR